MRFGGRFPKTSGTNGRVRDHGLGRSNGNTVDMAKKEIIGPDPVIKMIILEASFL